MLIGGDGSKKEREPIWLTSSALQNRRSVGFGRRPSGSLVVAMDSAKFEKADEIPSGIVTCLAGPNGSGSQGRISRSFRIQCLHALPTLTEHGLLREETLHGEANVARCPDFQHRHWQHHDAGLESPPRDGVPGQRRALT